MISGPAVAREGGFVGFSAEGTTDPDGDSLTFTWLPGDGRTFFDSLLTRIQQVWDYADNGTFTVSVIARDPAGAADTATTTLTVMNVPPTVSVLPPSHQAVGNAASANFAVSDSGRLDTHTIAIRWGDGTEDSIESGSEPWNNTVTHTYERAGSYKVSATVRDDDGGATTAEAARPVLVIDANARTSVAGYEVLDLGTLGGNSARPLDFNDYGKVVGSSLTPTGATHAFVWENGVMRDLGTMGHEGSEAQRINNAGVIAGAVWSGQDEDCRHFSIAAVWRNDNGTILDSKTAVRYPVRATAINESDDVTWSACGHENDYAWLWRDNRWYEFGSLLGIYGASTASSMNERGQIVGTADAIYTGESPYAHDHAFMWEDGTMRDLGLLGFRPCPSSPDRDCGRATAYSINERGQVVGFSTAPDGSYHAVLWDDGRVHDLWTVPPAPGPLRIVINDGGQVAVSAGSEAIFWNAGIRYTLGSLGGGSTDIVDMNAHGAIVGTSRTATGEQHAFVWTREGGMVDLGTGPHVFSAAWVIGISYLGDIAGFTAPCDGNLDNERCGAYEDVRAILWRRGTSQTTTRR